MQGLNHNRGVVVGAGGVQGGRQEWRGGGELAVSRGLEGGAWSNQEWGGEGCRSMGLIRSGVVGGAGAWG